MPTTGRSSIESGPRASGRWLRIAGAGALGAGACWIAWAALNAATGGGLDAAPGGISRAADWAGRLLLVGWNVLLVPAAWMLWRLLGARSPALVRFATVCGVGSMALWAYGGATRSITPALESAYLALSGVWWLGVGPILRYEHRALGTTTVVLGAFALWDALLVAAAPVPFWLVATSGPKLPLSLVWNIWLGIALLRRGAPARRADVVSSAAEIRA